jgi:hypothetical protein
MPEHPPRDLRIAARKHRQILALVGDMISPAPIEKAITYLTNPIGKRRYYGTGAMPLCPFFPSPVFTMKPPLSNTSKG